MAAAALVATPVAGQPSAAVTSGRSLAPLTATDGATTTVADSPQMTAGSVDLEHRVANEQMRLFYSLDAGTYDVYAKAVGAAKPASVPLAEGGGYGQKSVQQISDQLNTPLDTAVERLLRAGISQAAPDSNLRELATASSRRPFEIAQIIQGNAGS